jgi:hypothetical protein
MLQYAFYMYWGEMECITCKAPTSLGQSQKATMLQLGGGLLVLKNGWSIELITPCTVIKKAIRKQICITCKDETSLGQSEKNGCWQRNPKIKTCCVL